jgi:hypothetical protein
MAQEYASRNIPSYLFWTPQKFQSQGPSTQVVTTSLTWAPPQPAPTPQPTNQPVVQPADQPIAGLTPPTMSDIPYNYGNKLTSGEARELLTLKLENCEPLQDDFPAYKNCVDKNEKKRIRREEIETAHEV